MTAGNDNLQEEQGMLHLGTLYLRVEELHVG